MEDHPRPSVTVDIIVFTLREEDLQVLLIKRKHPPFEGMWAIPGGFVDIEESLEEAALRELEEETGVRDVYLEQLYTFGAPDRDPRGRTITVAYFAVAPASVAVSVGVGAVPVKLCVDVTTAITCVVPGAGVPSSPPPATRRMSATSSTTRTAARPAIIHTRGERRGLGFGVATAALGPTAATAAGSRFPARAARSAATISCPRWNRSPGRLASAFSTTFSVSADRAGLTWRGGGGGS